MSENGHARRSESYAFRGLAASSVPDRDARLAEELLPGAKTASRGWGSDGLPGPHARVAAITIHDQVTEAGLAACPRLEAIITRSDGYDHVDLAACEARGITVYHLQDYATQSVAQLALMMLTALARRVPEAMRSTQHGSWERDALVGHDLTERTVGIIGAGRIGSAVARLLDGMGVATATHDIDPDAGPHGLRRHRQMGLEELLDASDALSLHVPLTPETRHMIDGAALQRLGDGALVVNTCRGDVIDHAALLAALEAGTVAGYAADVLPGEPRPPALQELAVHPNVLLTPHLGAHNHATIRRRYERTAEIARAVLDGRPDDVAAYRVTAPA